MPYGKQCCGCNRCRWQTFLNTRTVRNHLGLYGPHVESCESQLQETCEPSSELSYGDEFDFEADDDNQVQTDVAEGEYMLSLEGCGDEQQIDWLQPEIENLSDLDESQDHRNFENGSSNANPIGSCSEESNHSPDDSADDSNDETDSDCDSTVQANDAALHSPDDWTFHYNKDLFSEGIATERFNDQFTVLQSIALNLDILTSHPSMSKTAFEKTLKLQKLYNPELKCWPETFKDAKRLIKPYLIEKKTFHVCPKNCVVYRNSSKFAYRELDTCPLCGLSRYHQNSLVPVKTFVYIPIGPRIARIFGEANLAKIVQSHCEATERNLDEMWDIHDSPTWNQLYSESGVFMGDKLGLSFAFEMDGVNPFHNIGIQYSMTPMQLTLLNFPRSQRNAFNNIFLAGIIPGGKSEASNLQPYVEILVDELLFLTGCNNSYRAYENAPVPVKIKLLLFVLDYPGLCKLFLLQGSGSYAACHWCKLKGHYCKPMSKMIYLCNRSYLPADHPLRKDTDNFVEKSKDKSKRPPMRNMSDEKAARELFISAESKKISSTIAKDTGYKGVYALSCLPDHDRLHSSLPDAMHTMKDVIQTLVKCITGKSGNIDKIRTTEQSYGRFMKKGELTSSSESLRISRKREMNASEKRSQKSSQPRLDEDQEICTPFVMSKEELKTADDRAESIRVPAGSGLKPGRFLTHTGSLKSHDWIYLATQGILKYCVRGLLGDNQRKTLFRFLDCLAQVCGEKQKVSDLDSLDAELNECLALLERDFPLSIQNITTHLLHHVVDGLKKFGPVYSTWMFVFERFNSWLCQRALNKRYPEATVVETYLIYDFCQFMHKSGRLPTGSVGLGPEVDEEVDQTGRRHQTVNLSVRAIRQLCDAYNQQDSDFHCGALDIEPCAMLYHRHVHRHSKTNRCTVYTSRKVQRSASKTVSCTVSLAEPKTSPCIGFIDHFISHKYRGDQFTFANVAWYRDVKEDQESGLSYVDDSSQRHFRCYHLMNELSPPLLTASDKESKLWFLNIPRPQLYHDSLL